MEDIMNSQSPLLMFKERATSQSDVIQDDINYDVENGFWRCLDGKPLINKMIESNNEPLLGQTTKTATREGIDQVESVFAQTSLTKTRESADQTESANSILGQTTITRTRESADQAESSSFIFAQTTITETRESADRSERVA